MGNGAEIEREARRRNGGLDGFGTRRTLHPSPEHPDLDRLLASAGSSRGGDHMDCPYCGRTTGTPCKTAVQARLCETTKPEAVRAYFAHPMVDYGTNREKIALAAIKQSLGPYAEVVNPNAPEHEEGYKARGDFAYWTELASSCQVVVYMAMPGGEMIGSGVWKEAEAALSAGRRVYEIDRMGERIVAVEHLDPERCMTVEATKWATRIMLAQKKGL